jgi:glycosyltransferase involved in cell wall biosynthesis
MPDAPVISVLMSVYNGEKYLAEAMDSILAQTFRDFELIVIDDGSKDSSPKMLQDYAKRDPRVKITIRENKGLTVTLNEAFAQSRGKYLARMDCDDVALPTRFSKQIEFLEANPEVVCTGGYFQLIDGAGRLLTTLSVPTSDAEIQAKLLAGHNAITHPCAMIRRTAMEKAGGYDTRFKTSQDLDLWLRLGEIGKLANIPHTVLKFRLHESSVSETKREQQRQMGRLACEEAWMRRELTNVIFEAGDPWRPGKDRASQHRFALQYGWWAFNSGERKTALIYGMKAIGAMPLKSDGWKLVTCAILKSSPLSPVRGGEG